MCNRLLQLNTGQRHKIGSGAAIAQVNLRLPTCIRIEHLGSSFHFQRFPEIRPVVSGIRSTVILGIRLLRRVFRRSCHIWFVIVVTTKCRKARYIGGHGPTPFKT
jgi:hypothetical protein